MYKNSEAVGVLLTRLILLNKGDIQSHPDMGVGIVKRYRYSIETSARDLQADIVHQIDEYLPQFQGAKVSVEMHDGAFYISIEIDDTVFMFLYDTKIEDPEAAVQTKYLKLSEL